ncbi:NHL repeat-containing protein [Rhodohalobacter halophilus]|uniref:hypothetical protein n=1 Tax=Rhodohalobacter halophilus TaxID=1812810 RepID=UPI00114CAE96|nr:hypothetical protein [Rhodohalobacter halophilus]
MEKASELDINVTDNALGEFLGEIVVDEENGYLYGVDLRARTAYRIALETGEATSLAPEGRGPQELSMPVQIAIGDNGIKIYDNSQNVIALLSGESIVDKFPAYGEHSVWVRGYAGYVWGEKLITSIEDPETVRELNFEEASPIGIFDYQENELKKVARFSPSVDKLDAEYKYPIIWFDAEKNVILYMLRTDYTLMGYDLVIGETEVIAGHKHPKYRVRSKSVNPGGSSSISAAMELGTSMSQVIGVNRVGSRIIIVWQNFNDGYYESQGDDSPGNVDYFGVGYDLSEPGDVVEFELPGRFLGVYDNQLMIEENMGAAELVIGFYEFDE